MPISLQVTCDAIKMLGKSASLILDEDDINKMNDTELEDCTEVLGNLNLKENVKKAIWVRLRKVNRHEMKFLFLKVPESLDIAL